MSIIDIKVDTEKEKVTIEKYSYDMDPFWSSIRRHRSMIDSRRVLQTLSKTESWFLWEMDLLKEIKTNQVVFSRDYCPEDKINTYPKIVTSLINKGLIIRLKQDNYLINPYLSTPKAKHYREVVNKWHSLGGKILSV